MARYGEARRRLRREGLAELAADTQTTCEITALALELERVSVWRFDVTGTSLRCVACSGAADETIAAGEARSPADDPPLWRAAASDAVSILRDEHGEKGRFALLAVPIRSRGRGIGLVVCESLERPRTFDALDEFFVGSVADHLSLVLLLGELDEQRLELAQALDAATMGVWTWDVGTNEIRWGEQVGPLFGKARGWAPSSYEEYMSLIHSEDRQPLSEAIASALEPGSDGYTVRHRILLGEGRLRWVEGRGRVERDAAGSPLRMRGTVMDVTERRALELSLAEAQRMEAVARLAGSVAHDFNNLLTTILGTADLLRLELEGHEDLGRDLDEILAAAARGGELTHRLLAHVRRELPVEEDAPTSVEAGVRELGQGELVLLVEDEPAVRKLAQRTLARAGCELLVAADGGEAISLVTEIGRPLDLLVTDVVMPGPSGVELAATLRARGLAERVLLMSGYAFDYLEPELPPNTFFLAKPFTASQLATRVGELLGSCVPADEH